MSPLALFSKLFPDEKFNPETSPVRVRQALTRLRGWARELRLPIRPEIDRVSGGYRLAFDGAFALNLPRDPLPLEPKELGLSVLLRSLDSLTGRFSIQDALAALDA